MNHPIGLTPVEIWNGLLGLAQAVAVIWAAYLIIEQIVANAQAPDHKQNERLDLIEERLAKIEAHIVTDRTTICRHTWLYTCGNVQLRPAHTR